MYSVVILSTGTYSRREHLARALVKINYMHAENLL